MFKQTVKRIRPRKGFKRIQQRPLLCVFLLLLAFISVWAARVAFLRVTQPEKSAFMRADPFAPAPIDFVPIENISPHLIRAVLVSEDNLFFSHSGFDWQSLKNAFAKNVKTHHITAGGSTLTQQLAKNLFLTPEKTWWRKMHEAALTLLLEVFLPKERILELYLNYAEMGPGIYGVSQASRFHFGVDPAKLTQTQASLLAATLINGKIYGKKPYPARTLQRQKKILYRMQNYALVLPENLKRKPIVTDKSDEKTVQALIQDVTAVEAEKTDDNFEEDFSTTTSKDEQAVSPQKTAEESAPKSPVFLDDNDF